MKNTEAEKALFGNKKMCIFFALVFLVMFMFLTAKGFHFLAVDSCLDSGGKWSDALNVCEMSEQSP